MRTITKHPSGIPVSVLRDRTVVKLLSVWSNRLHRFEYLTHRISPKNPKRAVIEKRRTQERQQIAKELRSIESDLMRWIGEITKHPDIYETPLPKGSDPLDPSTMCLRLRLMRDWVHMRQQVSGSLHPTYRKRAGRSYTQLRHKTAQQIMDLDWKWLSTLHQRVHPDKPLPPRHIVHPSRYKP